MSDDNTKNINSSKVAAFKREQTGERDGSAALTSGAELLAKKHVVTGEKPNSAASKLNPPKDKKLNDIPAVKTAPEKSEANRRGNTEDVHFLPEEKEENWGEKIEPENGENAAPKQENAEKKADVSGSGDASAQAEPPKEKPAKKGFLLKTESLAKLTKLYRHIANTVYMDGEKNKRSSTEIPSDSKTALQTLQEEPGKQDCTEILAAATKALQTPQVESEKTGRQDGAEIPADSKTASQTMPVQGLNKIDEPERVDSAALSEVKDISADSNFSEPIMSQHLLPPAAAYPAFTAPQTQPSFMYRSAANMTPHRREEKSIAYIVFVCLVVLMLIAASVSMLHPYNVSGKTHNPEEFDDGAQATENNKGIFIREERGVTILTIDGFEMIVVNKEFSVPSDYGSGVVPEAQKAFEHMMAAARSNGLTLYLNLDYLDYKSQQILFERFTNFYGEDKIRGYITEPGHSEHQLGLAFDVYGPNTDFIYLLDFNNTAEYIWLAAHAAEYGFILRYPERKASETGYEFEPWHFRYVGVELANIIVESGMAIEEYISQAQVAG